MFIWALGEAAVTKMTQTVQDNDSNKIKMSINQLYSPFGLHFIPERNNFHSRADFSCITREMNETAEDVRTRVLQTEKKCEFDNVTPAELKASKFLSLIGRSKQRTEENPEEQHDCRNDNRYNTRIYVRPEERFQ